MKPPKTCEELSNAIEQLVTAYVREAQQSAVSAIERSFSRTPKKSPEQRTTEPPRTRRAWICRTRQELDEIREKLYALICAEPGESMQTLAREMRLTSELLYLPMSKLKAEGRVRSVGERNYTRYFPGVVPPESA